MTLAQAPSRGTYPILRRFFRGISTILSPEDGSRMRAPALRLKKLIGFRAR
jgi:hypothetical protein